MNKARPAPALDRTGLPIALKDGIEPLSGLDLSDVRVHDNADKPAALNGQGSTEGHEIHLAPGQDRDLSQGPSPFHGAISAVIDTRNAGLVLTAPYLPRLWTTLNLAGEDAFVDEAAAEHAVRLLQFLVNGDNQISTHVPAINKLLCGLPVDAPTGGPIDVAANEKEVIESLLHALISEWSAIGQTSVAGLRETFLQREGHLVSDEARWQLTVHRMTFDVLVDRLPWSFSVIKFPWMPEPLHTTW